MRGPAPALDGLVGSWRREGTILGKRLVQDVSFGVVVAGASLRIHSHPSTVTPLTEEPYEAIAFVGRDPHEGGRPVMCLFGTFGAAYPVSGIGTPLDGVGIRLGFEDPEGRFLTDLVPDGDGWRIAPHSIAADGSPVPVGTTRPTRAG